MSHGPGQFPKTVADCHQLILDLHAELDQLEQRAARLRDEFAARRRRSVDGTGADCTDQSLHPTLCFATSRIVTTPPDKRSTFPTIESLTFRVDCP